MKNQLDQLIKCLEDFNIHEKSGFINMHLGGISLKIKDKSSLGNLIQEWFGAFMDKNKIHYGLADNSQEFPDYYLNENTLLLEIKTFDGEKSPNFDIANFDSYVRSLKDNPHRLFAKYLIFSYLMGNDGEIKISNYWLKNIWEISCASQRFPLKTQCKQDKIVNIRPSNFYSTRTKYKNFVSPIEFVHAIKETLNNYDHATMDGNEWYNTFLDNYKNKFKNDFQSFS